MNRDEARELVDAYVSRMRDRAGVELVVLEELTIERGFGWVFFYSSKQYVETGDPAFAIGGNAPLIVDRGTGELHVTGSAYPVEHYIAEYEARLRTP
ncbi:YrhB domain-containing protein [Corallococcus exercitus]|uniref:Immunity protein 35 domain-containing protein n=1 Tax=Corallococcus exercitus TaxID=2316736 RepID=A0A7Y4JZE5_9BACT|nr:YrhB domain-containing protein [Corallococcus exercitus]NOK14030.1 hypothetical protein [Corallococcus exercitus]